LLTLWLLPSLAIFPHKGPVGGNGNNGTNGNGTNGWRIEDGYFNPGLSDPGDAAVKSLQNHTYYRDVYVIVERLKDLQAIEGEDLVRNNIHASLRGCALDWYTVELTDSLINPTDWPTSTR